MYSSFCCCLTGVSHRHQSCPVFIYTPEAVIQRYDVSLYRSVALFTNLLKRHPYWLIRGGVSALSNHSLRGLKKATHRFKCWIQVCQIERHIITMPESEICSYFDQPWWHREMTLYHGKIILNWTIVRPTWLTEHAKETDTSYRMHRLNVRRNPAILCVYWFHAHLIHCYVYVINAKRRRRLCALRQDRMHHGGCHVV